eukprot:TRINITY_DN1119_c0_g1_i8.p1 TRINITY_DN1119_c0_g1~~TRINITY_DN1119_c0_g1_i8.p1  ORF type:complete len:193 (+),score=46.36 TRINITY_DN1119_c0_g1_i8:273-851(+)
MNVLEVGTHSIELQTMCGKKGREGCARTNQPDKQYKYLSIYLPHNTNGNLSKQGSNTRRTTTGRCEDMNNDNDNDSSTTNPLFCSSTYSPLSSSTHETTTLSLSNGGSSDGVQETTKPTIPDWGSRLLSYWLSIVLIEDYLYYIADIHLLKCLTLTGKELSKVATLEIERRFWFKQIGTEGYTLFSSIQFAR